MPYDTLGELPESVRNVLPKHAQKIYRAAFNHAWDTYQNPADRRSDASQEATAHKVARGAREGLPEEEDRREAEDRYQAANRALRESDVPSHHGLERPGAT